MSPPVCQSCQEREATILFRHIRGNEKRTLRLCSRCAGQRARKFEEGSPETPAPSAAGGPEAKPDSPPKKPAAKQINVVVGHLSLSESTEQVECGECGMTYKDFRKVGRLGCGGCYSAFSSQLERLFKRIHGAVRHEGKGPRPSSPEFRSGDEWQKLKEALRQAVAEEAYEKAAAIRDRIAQLEASEETGASGGEAGGREP